MVRLLFMIHLLFLFGFASQTTPLQKEKLLKLSLDVMLYNRDLEHAFEIAGEGAESMPDKRFWYSKAAQIAQWRGAYETAKHYYLLLYGIDQNSSVEKRLMELAHATADVETQITLLKRRLQKHYSLQTLKKLYRLFYNMGYLEEGVSLFTRLAHEHHKKEPAKLALLLQMEYAPRSVVAEAYRTFRKKYGGDTDLTDRYADILYSSKAYTEAFIELDQMITTLHPTEKKVWRRYADLALILRNEATLLRALRQMESHGVLDRSDEGLYLALLKHYDPQHALRFAMHIYTREPTEEHFFSVAYLSIDHKNLMRLRKLLTSIPPQLQKRLRQNGKYYRIVAWYHTQKHENKKAIAAYAKALKIAPLDENLHLSYLWMLIDSHATRRLEKELRFIERHFHCSDRLALPAALAYFQRSDTLRARRCIEKVVAREPENWQHLLLYADILALGGQSDMQNRILEKAWRIARKEASGPDAMHPDSGRYYDYMRLQLRFDPLHATQHLREAARVLDEKSLIDLALATLDPGTAPQKMLMLLNRLPEPTPSQQLSRALLQNDATILPTLQEGSDMPLSERLTLLQRLGEEARYTSLLFEALNRNPDNSELSESYTELLTQKPPRIDAALETVRRGTLTQNQMRIWLQLQKSPGLSFTYTHNRFHSGSEKLTRHHAALTLEEAFKACRLRLSAGFNQKDGAYLSYRAEAAWKSLHSGAKLSYAHATEDESNNHLLLHGRTDRLAFSASYRFDARSDLTLSFSHNRYRDSETKLGEGALFDLTYSRYLFLGYPDIYYRLLLSGADFTQNGRLPENYLQGGIETGFGTVVQNRFQSVARPYASATLLYNSVTGIGYSMLAGVGKRLFFHDRLGMELYYANGVDTRDEAYLLLRMRYRYW